uniref:Uncharacterized protein n=1 Tax=Arundo donax TaxID=35708 RepID=A0A0A9HJ38_ARUDO
MSSRERRLGLPTRPPMVT